ncbi:MAG: NAD(P)/FAD-dependent oxidoreductase [Myxococcota bacterium]
MRRIGTKYGTKTITGPFDAIVIGSGMGGLTVASLLAQQGQRVLVLEQHYTIGGCTHTFTRKRYEWDVGLHYVGDVQSPRSGLRRMFDAVTGGGVSWAPMPEIYNRIAIGDRIYEIHRGPEAYATKLAEYFPAQRAAIDAYVKLIFEVSRSARNYFAERAMPRAAGDRIYAAVSAPFRRYADRTTFDVLRELTDDPELIAVLCGNYGDYGLPPKRSSFAVQAMVARHYIFGASFPVGGPGMIARSIVPIIEQAGGAVVHSADVTEILVRDNRATGVKVAGGEEILAPRVISNAGVGVTFGRLLPSEIAERFELLPKLQAVDPAYTVAGLNIGLPRSGAAQGLPAANIWAHHSSDYDGDLERSRQDPSAPLPSHFITFPSMRDPTWDERHPDTATISMYSEIGFGRFEPWAHEPDRRRSEAYQALKDTLADQMLTQLEGYVPGIREQIDHYELSTPLTINRFLGRRQGNFMGIDHSPQRFAQRWLRPHTPVEHLYLTGQDVVTDGISGAMLGGFLCGSAILGRDLVTALGRG